MRPPPLRRLSRALLALSTLVLVSVLVFAGTVAYSASEIRPVGGPQTQWSDGPTGGVQGLVLTLTQNLSNPGLYPLSDVVVSADLWYAGGPLLHVTESPQGVAAGSTGAFQLVLPVNASASNPALDLLTQDAVLSRAVWVNASYALAFQFHLLLSGNVSWGAPFYGLTVTPTASTTTVEVAVRYHNHSPWDETGSLVASVVQSGGVPCTPQTLPPLNVPPGGALSQTFPVTLPSGCDPQGGSLDLALSGPGFVLPLVEEPIQ
jgi:hypothetical protein